MSIDFSQVKKITIPEGSVKKITDHAGNILWKEKSAEWHTIWEGNDTITITKSGTNDPVISGQKQNFVQTVAGTGYTPKIRITFSYSNTNTDYNNWENIFIINSKNVTTISSPVTIEAVKDPSIFGNNLCFLQCKTTNGKTILGTGLKCFRNLNTKDRINFSLAIQTSKDMSYNGNFTLTFTVTKIEQYY